MNAIELENVTKTFGQHTAVKALSLNVPQGAIYGFIGPNGSGKTTTIRLILRILYPDQGNISVFGETAHTAYSDRIGYLPEERGLYRRMKVREILRFYGELKNGRDINRQVDLWLDKLELNKWADKKVETLSKGMSQKVQFIAAVVAKPDLLILDEPFSGLDPVNTDVLRSTILDLHRQGTTIIFSTHDMSVAETLCDYIFMIFRGKKVLDGTLTSIQEAYGLDTIRLRTDAGRSALLGVTGIEHLADRGNEQEIRMAPGEDPQKLLTALMQRTRVTRFEIAKPSLHDIFVRIAGPEAQEVIHA